MKKVNVLFCGDFAPCRRYEDHIRKNGINVFGDALDRIKKSDVSFVNLECPLTNASMPISKSGPALKASPTIADVLKPFDIVGLANNHILDFNTLGLKDTIDALKTNNINYVGAGTDEKDINNFVIKEVNGLKIAIIAIAEREFNYLDDSDIGCGIVEPINNYRQIKRAQEKADIVIVTIHGGCEYFSYPRPGLRNLCKFYIELGVEAVICHHPHVPGGKELYKGKPIIYSLGNFIFDHSNPPKDWDFGYMVNIVFDVDDKSFESLELLPYRQSISNDGIKLLTGGTKKKFLDNIERISDEIYNESYMKNWNEFVSSKSNYYMLINSFPRVFKGLSILVKKFKILDILVNEKIILKKLNLIRCDSHREVLIATLESRLGKSKLK